MPTSSIIATLALALLVWVVLHQMGMALNDTSETLVVVGICAAVVSLIRWGWSKRRAKGE